MLFQKKLKIFFELQNHFLTPRVHTQTRLSIIVLIFAVQKTTVAFFVTISFTNTALQNTPKLLKII